MRNHKCGTCRFYQEAQLASSGWCHHPQRKTTSDIMIMVRKNELACRDEWAHDLWEPKTAQAGTSVSAPTQFPDRKERPATEAEIAALLAVNSPGVKADDPRVGASDIVLSELGPGPEPNTYIERVEPLPVWEQPTSRTVEPSDPQSTSGDHGSTPRGAIIRAREAYRERSRQMVARSHEIARLASNAPSSAPAALGASNLDAPDDELTVGQRDDQQTDLLKLSAPPEADVPATEEDAPDDFVVASTDSDTVVEPQVATVSDQARNDFEDFEPERPSWMDDMESVTANDPPTKVDQSLAAAVEQHPNLRRERNEAFEVEYADDRGSARSAEPDFDRTGTTRRPSTVDDDPSPWLDHRPEERRTYADHASYWSASGPSANRFDRYDHPDPAEDLESTDDLYDNSGPDVLREISATSGLIGREAEHDAEAVAEPEFESTYFDVVARDDAEEDVVIPLRSALSANLPRICRTCRDFRPAETSDRGWCANQWAFSHRRVVAADEQTPCESVIGDWWLPADDVWSDAADVSSHGQPTPLLDAWLPEYQEKVPSRRRS